MSAGRRLGRVLIGLIGAAALGTGMLATGSQAAAPSIPTAAAAAAPAAVAAHQHPVGRPSAVEIARMRAATGRFHNIAAAEDAGYGLLHDTAGITCIDMPGRGGMGVHWVNGPLVGDPTLDLRKAEALVYAPDRDGTLRLAAVEFIVDKAAWDANHTRPPQLFRKAPFDLTSAPNRYGLAPFYSQHVWIWRPNRAGVLSMWNPKVSCRAGR